MKGKSKSKIIYVICAVIIVLALGYTGSEFLVPKFVKANDNPSNVQAESSTTVLKTTEKITEIITTTIKQTNPPSTAYITTTVRNTTTEKPTVNNASQTADKTYVSTEPKTTQAPITVIAKDYSCFENSAFLGNSRVLALKNYGLVKNVYGSVGLTVETVFTDSMAGSNVPVIDEFNGKNFDKIFILFGDNECGWGNKDLFIKKYAEVIRAVKSKVPDAEIYLQSILPVSKHADEVDKFGCNNKNINIVNEKIKTLAEAEGVYFVEPSTALKGDDGTLPEDAASDGIHLNKKYCKIWLNYLVDNVDF